MAADWINSQVAGFEKTKDWLSVSIAANKLQISCPKTCKTSRRRQFARFRQEKRPTWTKFGCVLLVLDDVVESDAGVHFEQTLTFGLYPITDIFSLFSKLFPTLFTIVTTFYNLGSCCLRTLTCHLFLLWTSSRFHWIGHNKLFP